MREEVQSNSSFGNITTTTMKLFLSVLGLALVASTANAGTICPELKAKLKDGAVLDVIVQLPSINDVFDSPALASIADTQAATNFMISTLKERTAASRQPFVTILNTLGLGAQRSIQDPIWISNRFEIKSADYALVDVLSRIPGDFLIREPKVAHIIDPLPGTPVKPTYQSYQWGVEMIKAPEAWNKTQGEGIIVGIIDTGVHMTHEALRDSYAGAWSDPYYTEPTPTDLQSHGTHCIGSTLGRTNGIGVAPGAQWIACRGLNHQGSGSEANLLSCAQWMLSGANPKPNIVTNSWGGGSGDDWYDDAMRAWIQANIVPVFALGNSGSLCASANSPGDSIYAFGVGATNVNDQVASFSSRGPSRWQIKPEVSAPGENVVSAGNTGTNSYTTKSGTSMATPHVAGACALLMSQNPNMTVYEVIERLKSTGDHPPVTSTDRACNPDSNAPEYPNNSFGYSRINCANAVA